MTEALTPEDIEAVDASDVEWHETALALQKRVTELEGQLAEAEAKLSERAAADAAQVTPLKDYKSGDPVSVLKNGDWLLGIVSEKDKVSNHLHVNTERGPVTVASTRFIKRLI
jgi:hypothetical protein